VRGVQVPQAVLAMSTMYGPKIRDGLRAYREQAEHRYEDDQPAGYWFADAVLMRMGYPEKVADSIIDRLGRVDLIEWGVSARTGWLTERGEAALAGRRYSPDPDIGYWGASPRPNIAVPQR